RRARSPPRPAARVWRRARPRPTPRPESAPRRSPGRSGAGPGPRPAPRRRSRQRRCGCRGHSLLVLLLVDDLGVHDIVRAAGLLAAGLARATGGGPGRTVGAGLLVEGRTHLLGLGGELLHGRLDGLDVGALQRRLDVADRAVHRVLHVGRELLVVLLDELLGLVDESLGLVAGLGLLTPLLVLGGVLLGLAHHALDLLLRQGGATGD